MTRVIHKYTLRSYALCFVEASVPAQSHAVNSENSTIRWPCYVGEAFARYELSSKLPVSPSRTPLTPIVHHYVNLYNPLEGV